MLHKPEVPLAGFGHFTHHWFAKENCYAVKIKPGEFYVTRTNEAIVTTLGSCVSACITDPVAGVGGMNHFILPVNSDNDDVTEQGSATRYGAFAMEQLINEILKFGGKRERLVVKVTGGGQMIPGMSDIGAKNIAFVRQFLAIEHMNILSDDTGGTHGRKVAYLPLQGRLLVKRLPALLNNKLYVAESQFQQVINKSGLSGDVELF